MGDSNVELVKERTDIVALIGEQVKLKKAGVNFKGLCPFHNEKTPSFVVSPNRQMFHCFGCSKSGDIFTWVMEKEGMTFAEALRVLANRAGITLAFERTEHREERERLRATLDTTADFYHTVLQKTAAGKVAREYLLSRGLTEASISEWRLGYVPPMGTPIIEKANKRGVSTQDLLNTGIIAPGRNGYYERFYSRVLFPLSDMHGSVVGLAGRILKTDPNRPAAKYINSPETTLYRKSRILYGLDKARNAIREKDYVIIVEGYTDVIGSHQAGVTNVVATSGTALTDEHLQVVRRFTENIVFSFDGDAAGDEATRRAIDMAVATGFSVTIVLLPNGQDPADVAIKDPEAWKKAIEDRIDVFNFLLKRAVAAHTKMDAAAKKEITAELLPLLARIPEAVVRGEYLQRLGEELGLESRYLNEDLKRLERSMALNQPQQTARSQENKPELDPRTLREERLLTLLLVSPGSFAFVQENLPSEAFIAQHTRNLYNEYLKLYNATYRKEEPFDFSGIKYNLPEDLKRLVDIFLLAIEVEQEEGLLTAPDQEIRILLRELVQAHIRENLHILTKKLEGVSQEESPLILQEIAQLTEKLVQAERLTT